MRDATPPPFDLSAIRYIADEVVRVRSELNGLRDTIGARLLQQDEAVRHVLSISGDMERVHRLMETHAKLWNELSDEVRTWTALRGRDIEVLRRDLEKTESDAKEHRAMHERGAGEMVAVTTARIDSRTRVLLALIALGQFVLGVLIGRGTAP